MRPTKLIALVLAISAVACAAFGGTANAYGATPCGATQTFASWGDSANYVQMQSTRGTSLTVPGGSTGTFQGSCVAFLDPQVRLLAANTGDPSGTLTVSAQYTDAWGSHNVTLATFGGSSRVQPSPTLVFNPWQLEGNVQVTVSASPGSNWVISGVYVDPFLSR